MVPDVPLWRALWADRLDEYLWVTSERIGQFAKEAELPGLLARTRDRLRLMHEAKRHERARIEELLGDLKGGAGATRAKAVPVRRSTSGRLAVLEYYEHIFRDWGWGTSENERYRDLIAQLAPNRPRRLAVLGAGAARLPFEVHRALGAEETWALDINPLPLVVAARLLRGEMVELFEFPRAPRSDACNVVREELRAPVVADPGFHLVIADCLHLPFAPESLEAVLTPWFIDATTADVRSVAAIINRVLAPGGTWINFGPLHFDTPLYRAYLVEEVMDIVREGGFEVVRELHESVPYFHSPYSGSLLHEMVHGFSATKVRPAPVREVPGLVPPWVSNPELPVPRMQGLAVLERTSAFTAAVISMVDGHRSIADLARALSIAWQMDEPPLRDELRAFFSKLPFE